MQMDSEEQPAVEPAKSGEILSIDDAVGQKRILLVDDDAGYASALQRILKQKGYELIDYIDHPVLALEHLAQHSYDLILTDYDMTSIDKGMTGTQFYTQAKEICPQTPVIMLSGSPNLSIQSILDIGIKYFLRKTDNPEKLYDAMADVLSS